MNGQVNGSGTLIYKGNDFKEVSNDSPELADIRRRMPKSPPIEPNPASPDAADGPKGREAR